MVPPRFPPARASPPPVVQGLVKFVQTVQLGANRGDEHCEGETVSGGQTAASCAPRTWAGPGSEPEPVPDAKPLTSDIEQSMRKGSKNGQPEFKGIAGVVGRMVCIPSTHGLRDLVRKARHHDGNSPSAPAVSNGRPSRGTVFVECFDLEGFHAVPSLHRLVEALPVLVVTLHFASGGFGLAMTSNIHVSNDQALAGVASWRRRIPVAYSPQKFPMPVVLEARAPVNDFLRG